MEKHGVLWLFLYIFCLLNEIWDIDCNAVTISNDNYNIVLSFINNTIDATTSKYKELAFICCLPSANIIKAYPVIVNLVKDNVPIC